MVTDGRGGRGEISVRYGTRREGDRDSREMTKREDRDERRKKRTRELGGKLGFPIQCVVSPLYSRAGLKTRHTHMHHAATRSDRTH